MPFIPGFRESIILIKQERKRQIEEEGFTFEHDDQYTRGELLRAAFCYCSSGVKSSTKIPSSWKLAPDMWKPSDDRIRNLVKAGAIFRAEHERLQREGEMYVPQEIYCLRQVETMARRIAEILVKEGM